MTCTLDKIKGLNLDWSVVELLNKMFLPYQKLIVNMIISVTFTFKLSEIIGFAAVCYKWPESWV